MTTKQGAARPGTGTAPSNAAAAKLLNLDFQRSDGYDSNRGLLTGGVGYVTGGWDRPVLDRLTTAAEHGRELVDGGADPVSVVAGLTLAGEAAALPRRRAEAVIRSALRSTS